MIRRAQFVCEAAAPADGCPPPQKQDSSDAPFSAVPPDVLCRPNLLTALLGRAQGHWEKRGRPDRRYQPPDETLKVTVCSAAEWNEQSDGAGDEDRRGGGGGVGPNASPKKGWSKGARCDSNRSLKLDNKKKKIAIVTSPEDFLGGFRREPLQQRRATNRQRRSSGHDDDASKAHAPLKTFSPTRAFQCARSL